MATFVDMRRHLTTPSNYPTIRETAARTAIGERALRAAVERGELVLYRPAGAWPRLYWPEVEAWIRAARMGGSE